LETKINLSEMFALERLSAAPIIVFSAAALRAAMSTTAMESTTTSGTRNGSGVASTEARGPETYFVSGDLYKGDSPQILGTTPWDTQVSGGDINARWEHNLSGSKGFYLQGYVARALRSGVPVDEARNTYDIDFIHHFGVVTETFSSYGGTLHWSPYQVSQALFSILTGRCRLEIACEPRIRLRCTC
jgi:hypothetical protein